MIKLFLKHKIAETAINAFFNQIEHNFMTDKPTIVRTDMFVGKRFNIIEVKYTIQGYLIHDTIYNATITKIDSTMFTVISDKPYRHDYNTGNIEYFNINYDYSAFLYHIVYLE